MCISIVNEWVYTSENSNFGTIKYDLAPLWGDVNAAVDYNVKVTKDYYNKYFKEHNHYKQYEDENNRYINTHSWWFRNNGSLFYNNETIYDPSTAHDKFYNFVTKHDFLQIVKDEIMQGKLQYPLMNFDIRYTFIKIFVILKKDFDKAQGKPEGWEFAKDDEEKHCREKKVKWEYKEVVRLPKPILPIQRDNVTIWDNRFGVIPIQQYEMDPHKIGLTDEQIIAMFNGLKDSFLYDYAYGEYFKNYLPDLYEKIHEYYLSYILNDTSDNCGGIGYYRWCYERKDDTCGLYSDIKNWINNIIEWELRRRFQPLIDRYWINGVDTLGVFTPTKVIPTEQEPEPNEVGASWCDDNGKWYIFLVTDCYHQAHTQAR